MNRVGTLLLLFLSMVNITHGDILTESFFRLPPDAVSRSVGGANQAYSVGAADLFINPALLSQHTRSEMQFSNMINLLSKQYMSVAYSAPVNSSDHVGIGLIGLDNSLTEQSADKNVHLRQVPLYQYGLVISYSRSIASLSVGASVKYFGLGEEHDESFETTSGFGVDLGFSYTMNTTTRIGFVYQSPFNIRWNSYPGEFIPGRMGISAVWTPAYFTEQCLQFLFGMDRYEDEPPQMNVGIAINAIHDKLGMKNFSIRAGLGNFELNSKSENGLLEYLNDSAPIVTVGAGLGIKTGLEWIFHLDYCFQIKEYISNKHIVTTRIEF